MSTSCPPPVHSALSRSVLSLVLTQSCPGHLDSTWSFSAFRAGSAMSQPALSSTLSCPGQQAVKEICKYLQQIFKSLLKIRKSRDTVLYFQYKVNRYNLTVKKKYNIYIRKKLDPEGIAGLATLLKSF